MIPASLILEPTSVDLGIVGWLDMDYLPWFLALALIAGILGHTGLNTCLRYTPPLVVSTSVTMEPIIGSLIGYAIFDSGLPGFWTWIGGPILIAGIILVIIGTPQDDTNNDTIVEEA